jgi:molecular chaperone DnaK (HSP70)
MPLAGDALDAVVARDLAAELAGHGIDVGAHPQPDLAWALLERAAREAKVRLSQVIEHPVVLPAALRLGELVDPAAAGPQPVLRYHRHRLEAAFQSQMDGACNLVISALRAARLAQHPATAAQLRALGRDELTAGIDFVLLVGGMSRIPYVRRRLAELFPSASIVDDAGVPPEEAVVAGLADAGGYDRIRLHRPAFDLVLDVDLAEPGGPPCGKKKRVIHVDQF